MKDTILATQGGEVVPISSEAWEAKLAKAPEETRPLLAFMSADHHRVRYFLVRELVRTGQPVPASSISEELDLPAAAVRRILDELERSLFFLVRNRQGDVSWAYPVTVEPTAHRLQFSSGERLWGA